jgi:hypothetical protein
MRIRYAFGARVSPIFQFFSLSHASDAAGAADLLGSLLAAAFGDSVGLIRLVRNLAKTHASFENRRFLTVGFRRFLEYWPKFQVFSQQWAVFPA